jgi:hypothetical protein
LSQVQDEIRKLEDRLRLAELGPDARFFAEVLDDNFVAVTEDGRPFLAKTKVVEAHQPGNGPKFTRVEMNELKIVDHGSAAVVTCIGTFEAAQTTFTLRFMRVWIKKAEGWKIVAGSVFKV